MVIYCHPKENNDFNANAVVSAVEGAKDCVHAYVYARVACHMCHDVVTVTNDKQQH